MNHWPVVSNRDACGKSSQWIAAGIVSLKDQCRISRLDRKSQGPACHSVPGDGIFDSVNLESFGIHGGGSAEGNEVIGNGDDGIAVDSKRSGIFGSKL